MTCLVRRGCRVFVDISQALAAGWTRLFHRNDTKQSQDEKPTLQMLGLLVTVDSCVPPLFAHLAQMTKRVLTKGIMLQGPRH